MLQLMGMDWRIYLMIRLSGLLKKKTIRVLDKFTPDLPGYHLYYPHRRHAGSAFSLFIDRLKYKGAVEALLADTLI